MHGEAERGAARLRTVGSILTAVLVAGGGAAVAIAAPTFEPSPGSTRTAPSGTDANFTALAPVPPTPGSPAANLYVASFVVTGGQQRTRGLLLRGGGTANDVFGSMADAISAPGRGQAVASGDVDGDGRADVALQDLNGAIRVLRDKPLGFDAGAGTAYFGTSPQLEDVNGDGRADLVSASNGNVDVRLSAGDGSFGPPSSAGTGQTSPAPTLVAGDVDGDGRADAVAMLPGSTLFYRGQATGPPLAAGTPVTYDPGSGSSARRAAIGDVDGDGTRDLAFLLSDDRISVVRGAPRGGFLPPVLAPRIAAAATPSPRGAIAAFDADADGDADLVAEGMDGQVRLLEATTGGALAAPVTLASADQGSSVAAGDFDADGRPDLAHLFRTSTTAGEVRVLRNTTLVPPRLVARATVSAVTATSATVSARVRTVQPGAQVVVRYGTTEALDQAAAPVAVGPRQDAAPVESVLTGLTPGTRYFARVIAFNDGGSAESELLTFTTAATPPPPPPADHAVSISVLGPAPDLVIGGAVSRVRAAVSGANGPFTLAFSFDDGSDGTILPGVERVGDVEHQFFAETAHDANVVKGATERTVYRRISVSARDRFGRSTNAAKVIAVRPDAAPVASIAILGAGFEYGRTNSVVSLSRDPDAPLDDIAREQWDLTGDGVVDVNREAIRSACVNASPPVVTPACLGAGPAGASLLVAPWEEELAALGRGPLTTFELPAAAPAASGFEARVGADRARAAALREAAKVVCTVCGKKGPPARKLRLTVSDGAGKSGTVERTVRVRRPARPQAAGTLDLGTNETLLADKTPGDGSGTRIRLNPTASSVDRADDPAWYVLEVGTPWQVRRNGTLVGSPCFGDLDPVKPGLSPPASPSDVIGGLGGPGGGGFSGSIGSFEINQFGLSARPRALSSVPSPPSPATQAPSTFDVGSAGGDRCDEVDYGVNDPLVVITTKDPGALGFTLPAKGSYAALLTVYDRYGQQDKIRFDGLQAIAGSATCASRAFRTGNVSKLKGPLGLNATGSCVSYETREGGELAWTTSSLAVNGVKISPEAGGSLVYDTRKGRPKVLYAAKGVPKPGGAWGSPKEQKRALADVRLGGVAVARISPVIAGEAAPKIRIPGSDGVPRVPLDSPFDAVLPRSETASYEGLAISETVQVRMGSFSTAGARGSSDVDFQVELPTGFGPVDPAGNPVGQPPTAATTLRGNVTVNGLTVTTTDLRRARAARARKAQLRVAGLGQSTIEIEGGTQIGGFALPEGFSIKIDPATGSGVGTVKLPLSFLPPGAELPELTVRVERGKLASVFGRVPIPGPGLPIGTTPASFTAFGFGLNVAPPFALIGTAEIRVADTLGIVGAIKITPADNELELKGDAFLNAQITKLPLLNAQLTVGGKGLTIGGGFSYGTSGVSLNGTVTGVFGAAGFNLAGRGNACLGVCLSIDALLSNIGAAACGELDLLLTTVRFGFGVYFSPFDVNLYGRGCNTAPYAAAVTRGAGFRQVGDAEGVLTDSARTAGQSKTIVIPDDGLDAIGVVVRSLPGAGAAPRVTLDAISGNPATPRTFTTPSGLGDYAVAGRLSFVDSDPIAGVTRFIVPKPRKGTWTLRVDPGSTPVASVALSRAARPVVKKSFSSTKVLPTSTKLARSLVARGELLGLGMATKIPKTIPGSAIPKMRPRAAAVRRATPMVPVKGDEVSRAETDDADLRRVTRLVVRAADLEPGDRVTFSERGAATGQQLGTYVVPANGRVAAELAFEPARSPDLRRTIDAFVTTNVGLPRATVPGVATFQVAKVAAKDPPDIRRVLRSGRTRRLVLAGGPSYPGLRQPEWRLTGVGSLGTRISRDVSGADVRRRGGRWELVLRGIEPSEDFRSLRLVGLSALGAASGRGAERARSNGADRARVISPKRRGKRR